MCTEGKGREKLWLAGGVSQAMRRQKGSSELGGRKERGMEGGGADLCVPVGVTVAPNTELVHRLPSVQPSLVSNSAPFIFLLSLNLEDRLLKGTIVLTLQMGH